jgi:hypothetical protein
VNKTGRYQKRLPTITLFLPAVVSAKFFSVLRIVPEITREVGKDIFDEQGKQPVPALLSYGHYSLRTTRLWLPGISQLKKLVMKILSVLVTSFVVTMGIGNMEAFPGKREGGQGYSEEGNRNDL